MDGAVTEKGYKRILRAIKEILSRYFGKARWFVIGIALILLIQILTSVNIALNNRIEGVQDENDHLIRETGLRDVRSFSANRNGLCVVSCGIGRRGLVSVFDPDTGIQDYAGNESVIVDTSGNQFFRPENFVLTDNDILYAVRTDQEEKYSIVKLSKEYDFLEEVCSLVVDQANTGARLSRLHYSDGRVTFAVVERYGVRLYALDTESNNLSIRAEHVTEGNGIFPVQVIPIDGAFLILQSDGNVYQTTVDDPARELICRFDTTSESAVPYFTQAVIYQGELCFFDENRPGKIYRLENGQAKVLLDLADVTGYEESAIAFLETCGNPEQGDEKLAVCLSDGLLTFSDGTVTPKDIQIQIKPYWMYYAREIWETMYTILLYSLVIHLILRKKTLFYKQMLVTLPLFVILATEIVTNLYDYTFSQKLQSIRNELEIISGFGAKELEGEDFSALMKADGSTGAAYRRLYERLKDLNSVRAHDWNEDYELSVVCRRDNTSAVILVDEETVDMPMGKIEEMAARSAFLKYDGTGDSYISETILNILDMDVEESEICAYGRIGSGKDEIYLKISTDNSEFIALRGEMLVQMYIYSALVILLLTAIFLFSSLRTTEVIRKAMGALRQISEGDLSARVRYKSKDELGDICTQVNSMGEHLQESFAEKDRTEKFYYRFVPEQFRQLLGKEKFTDLALGDSASRELTVLFCDISSSVMRSQTCTAAESFDLVNRIYGIVGPIIRLRGGFVDKYMGEAVMALFENADDAVSAGIEIYHAVVTERQAGGGSDIRIGIGIHSGMARIGIVGESERLSGTVISDTVNLSSRLESLTKQYQTAILVSKDTVDRMADPDALDLRYLGIVQVAGVNEVKSVYEVLDCLPEEERRKRRDNSATLREAVRLFHLGRRDETIGMLRGISILGKSDHVTEMYLDYIRNLSVEDKGNVFRFVRK